MYIEDKPVGSDPDLAHVGRIGEELDQGALVDTYSFMRDTLDVRHFDTGRLATTLGLRGSLLDGVTAQRFLGLRKEIAIAVTEKGRFITRASDYSRGDASWVQWEGLPQP
jgi:hypothetical protein